MYRNVFLALLLLRMAGPERRTGLKEKKFSPMSSKSIPKKNQNDLSDNAFPSSKEMPKSWFKAGPEEVGLEGPALHQENMEKT